MFCRNCGHEIPNETEICVKCGVPALKSNKFCNNCGKGTTPEQVMCTNCGAKLKTTAPGEEKDWTTALLLSILPMLVGLGGIHRFYTGHIAAGVIQLLTLGGCFIWQLVDIIRISTGNFKDSDGRNLAK